METKYTTVGSVRGCCGHVHATLARAEACLRRDEYECYGQRGYSDRRVVGGTDYTYPERCAMSRRVRDAVLDRA